MPNHCWNYLQAPDGDISVFEQYLTTKMRGSPFISDVPLSDDEELCLAPDCGYPETFLDFQKIIPMAQNLLNGDGWYDWRIRHWGTKWNSYDGHVQDEGIGFNTAWGPPTPVIAALSKLVQKPLRLTFDEPGNDFCGEFLANPDGTCVDNTYSPRDQAPEALRDELGIDDEEELDRLYEQQLQEATGQD
jgi:hypothetical protein